MKLIEILQEAIDKINEKLIILNQRNAKSGNIMIVAGAGGSGKGFALTNFVASNGYKIFNVDDIKPRLIKLAKLGRVDKSLADLDLKNPEDTRKLHQYVKDHKLDSKLLTNFVNAIDTKRELPNIGFDLTFSNKSSVEKKLKLFQDIGYEPKNTHLIWVLTNFRMALKNNKSRDRAVPEDILISAHNSTARNMADILKGNVPKSINGEVHVILNNKKETVRFVDSKGKEYKNSVKSFTSVKVKEAGKPLDTKLAKDMVFKWFMQNVPKGAKDAVIG